MKKLIKELYQNRIPVNDGYEYLFSDEIYLPLYQSTLIVTKRTIMPLSLVEEMVLKLLENEVYQIDEMSKILGMSRRLLEITLADLYSRDLVAVSADSCRLLTLGRKALRDLSRSEKKQDIIKDIYIDAVKGEIFDAESYQVIDNVYWNDNKLKASVPLGNIKSYTEHFSEISEIFKIENKLILSEGMQPVKEELLTIDKVENTFVKFVKIPIHVYAGSNGMEIDILSTYPKTSDLFNKYKEVILEQINQKKILKNHFKNRNLKDIYDGNIYNEKKDLSEEVKIFHFKGKKTRHDYKEMEDSIFSIRKLFQGEYKIILKYLVNHNTDVIVHIDNLENWVYDTTFCNLLQEIMEKKELLIFYAQCKDEKKSVAQIKRNYSYVKAVAKDDNKYYICWEIGEFRLFAIPRKRNVIDENTTCIITDYYLEKRKDSI